jgi:tRNA(fMet)-specific endonuclease VapC
MDTVLLDTDLLSYFFKSDTRAQQHARLLKGGAPAISFMTVAELYRWALRRNWGRGRIARLSRTLSEFIIISYDDGLGWEWARVMTMQGHPMNPADAWIAATAIRHGLPLLTGNVQHFEHLEPQLRLIRISRTPP